MKVDKYKVLYIDENGKQQEKVFYRYFTLVDFLKDLMEDAKIDDTMIEIKTLIL